MKKILTSIAMVLLLAGCAKQYDDSAIQTRIADLERRVTALESSVDALRSAIGEGVFVAKVQEYADPETGKTIGVTVTYTNSEVKYFEITPKADYAGPVIGIIKNGAGDLVWAVDGIAIKDADGKDVTVYQTPVFTIDGDGNLLVSIDGGDPIILGQVQNEGATLVDGIFTDIKVEQDKIVLTLSDDTVVNIPFAAAFKLSIETDDVVYEKRGEVIEVPYQVSGKTSGTVVDVMGYDPNYFDVEVTAEKILITPLTSQSAAVMSVIADSKVGLVSIVKLCVNYECAYTVDPTPDGVWADYAIDSDGGSVVANIVSNVEVEAVPDDGADWITIVETKAMNAHTITMTVAANTETSSRTGCVDLFKKGTDKYIESIYIYQEAFVPGPKDLGKEGTANCYIVTAAGEYKFKAVKGNTTESVGTVAKAELYWETVNTDTAPEENSIIASVSYNDEYVIFSTPATLKPGNALIAVKDASDVILWSWHIWIPATAIETASYGGIMDADLMDRNLGALVAAEAGTTPDVTSFGLMYQWGRKDPFPGVAVTPNTPAKLTKNTPSKAAGTITLAEAIANPSLMGYTKDGDWLNASDETLWLNAEKTMYDPCPPGYRMPVRNGDKAFWSSDMSTKAGWAENNSGCWFTLGDPVSVFPFAGYIDDDGLSYKYAGTRALYWTAHRSGSVTSYGADVRYGDRHKLSSPARARAGSVRCTVAPAASN